jgi:hypothetical protein
MAGHPDYLHGARRLRQLAVFHLRLLHEFQFQLHRADSIDLAVDIVIAFD